ncbi:unnamed protein product [Schistosoma margrebowiei]|uniref:Uncharacterized protein n=1 Tax=Schistosoma margrebowiei TaxID=48269 RepID=A0A183MYL8_9TREM|nr:unnamed protein product [Schistosoma margrebowiei]
MIFYPGHTEKHKRRPKDVSKCSTKVYRQWGLLPSRIENQSAKIR